MHHPAVRDVHPDTLAYELLALPGWLHEAACTMCTKQCEIAADPHAPTLQVRVWQEEQIGGLVRLAYLLASLQPARQVHVCTLISSAPTPAIRTALEAFILVAAEVGVKVTLAVEAEESDVDCDEPAQDTTQAMLQFAHSKLAELELCEADVREHWLVQLGPLAHNCTSLRALLCTGDRGWGSGQWAALSGVLLALPSTLTRLHIHGSVEDEQASAMAEAIASCTGLRELEPPVACCAQLLPPLRALVELTSLCFDELAQGHFDTKKAWQLLAGSLERLTKLQRLDVGMSIKRSAMRYCSCLFPGFRRVTKLTQLHMLFDDQYRGQCGVSSELAKHIGVLSQLQHLDLYGCHSEGDVTLASSLTQLSAVSYLSWHDAGPKAVAALRPALAGWIQLHRLDLQFCGIDDAACGELAGGLAQHSMLRTLDLSQNSIGDAGASALAKVLPQCCKLSELYLACNKFDAWDIEGLRLKAAVLRLPAMCDWDVVLHAR